MTEISASIQKINVERETFFTHVALREDKDIWWAGIGYPAPGKLIDWKGNSDRLYVQRR